MGPDDFCVTASSTNEVSDTEVWVGTRLPHHWRFYCVCTSLNNCRVAHLVYLQSGPAFNMYLGLWFEEMYFFLIKYIF